MSEADSPNDLSPAAEAFAEFLGRRSSAGGTLDFDAFCAERPELELRLRRLHARWQELNSALSGGLESDDAGPSITLNPAAIKLLEELEQGTAGRYEVGSEIGRGGMGIVRYVWDRSLHRMLAMKVLPTGATDSERGSDGDPRFLARFLEEAQITGQLDHPGILPVHELGLDGDRRVYFTMPLVRGRSFAEIIDLVHAGDPEWTLTRALDVLVKVCEAVAFAHAKGVLHRDLKPDNVMVGRFGETYVMDWGLARVVGEQDRIDLRWAEDAFVISHRSELTDGVDSPLVTRAGDVVGTPAYMPPEQARGEIESIGVQSDVYSVGAMLYHLLAGRMPFVSARESSREVLANLRAGRPEPLSPEVPAELAAICDKAMAREPAERYGDLREFAQDLRAFIEVRVVKAYGGGAIAELRKWVERNKVAALASAAAALALVSGLIATAVLRQQAVEHAARADEQATLATANFDLAFGAVERMLERVSAEDLDGVPGAYPARESLLIDALEFYQALLDERGPDPQVQRQIAYAQYRLARLHQRLGDNDAAGEAAHRSLAAFTALIDADPDPGLRVDRAVVFDTLGSYHGRRGEIDEAVEWYGRALAEIDELPDTDDYREAARQRREHVHGDLGTMFAQHRQFDRAIEEFERALALTEQVAELDAENAKRLATRHVNLGFALMEVRRLEDARVRLGQAVTILRAQLEELPNDESLRGWLGLALSNLGVVHNRLGQRDRAREVLEEGLAVVEALVEEFPNVPKYRYTFGLLFENLASIESDFDVAIALLGRAIAEGSTATRLAPDLGNYRRQLATHHRRRLMKFAGAGRHREIAATVAELPAVDPDQPALSRSAATFLAYGARSLLTDDAVEDDEREDLLDDYARRIVDHLREAFRRGFEDRQYLSRRHFDPVREHPVFKQLLAELGDGF